ncbi:MAG: SnoaL-like domain-containing protein [Rhodothermaceae bacterium]|nr:SnoaL-like domain-containing protein [Rhodothermaceae bacterium]
MPTPHAIEAEVLDTVHAFMNAWMQPAEEAVDGVLAHIAEDFTGLGTGPGDYYPNREAFQTLIEREKEEMPYPSDLEVPWIHVRLLHATVALVEAQLHSTIFIEGDTHVVEPRFSLVLERREPRWLIVHCHFSIADAMQEVGDTLMDALEGRNRELERLVAERTAELEAAQAQLIQKEKMASLGQLTAGIAHEIKNPLNFVNNFAGLSQELITELEEEPDSEDRQALLADLKANAAKIEEHGRRADTIVRQMMEHARSGRGERRAVELNALVEEYANLAYHGKRARHPAFQVAFEQELAEDIGEVVVVPQEIGRVLINLLDNAFDAVQERSAGPDDSFVPTVRITTHRLGEGGAEVCIEDNGAGIPEAARARVFEPFFTTKPTGEGTGLGLSLAYDIVTHGYQGSLVAESAEGEGAVFRMVLPASLPENPA